MPQVALPYKPGSPAIAVEVPDGYIQVRSGVSRPHDRYLNMLRLEEGAVRFEALAEESVDIRASEFWMLIRQCESADARHQVEVLSAANSR